MAAPRLTAAAKVKQPARATSLTDPSKVERTEAEIVLIRRVSDVPSDDSEEEISWNSFDDEDVDAQDKDSDDDDDNDDEEEIAKIDEPKDTESGGDDEETKSNKESDEDDGNGEEDQDLRISKEERIHEEEEADELYRDVWSPFFTTASSFVAHLPSPTSTMTPSIITTTTTASQPPIPPTPIPSEVLQNLPTFESVFRFKDKVKSLEVNFSKFMQTNQFLEAISNIPDRGSKRRREGGEHASASTPSEPATRSAGRSPTGTQSRQMSASESSFAEEPPRRPPTPDHDWNKTLPAVQGSAQPWISELAKKADARSSFNELLDTPLDFSNFIMNRLGVDTLTPELLAGPTYELMRGSCQQYPHNLLQPLPLIPDKRGRHVILFAHFINNDLEYLRGGASSRKYTTSVIKTKAADYGHIKWIEDLVPRTMWIQEPLNYYKHTLWGVSHWGWKRQQFYGLCLQDIEDMLLLLVQGKLSNLTVEEHFAFNVSLRMFTRSIVIQWRVKDLQLRVESYQKRLNLTKPDTYRSDLKRREMYTAYSYPRGFIYQNKDKKNRLMRIDELQKFSDGTLNDVRNALDDRLKGIRMQYLPTIIWRKGDKDRATAVI
nr:hypothetical protein [Tanacetum cinerariifolium]